MTTNEKLSALREQMSKSGLDAYIVGTADFHQSEYVSDYFKERAWLTGFTGSAGTALVTRDHALLWADGRYFIQAAQQIRDSEFKLMKMATPGYPDLKQWLKDNLTTGSKVGINEATCSQSYFEQTAAYLKAKGVELIALPSLIDPLWKDRPALPEAPCFQHEEKYTGQSARDKIQHLRQQLQADDTQATVIINLDDVAWLYNFRGNDVAYNPVTLAYALVTREAAYLFVDRAKISPDLAAYFADQGILVQDYAAITEALAGLQVDKIAVDKNRISCLLFRSIPEQIEVADRTSYVYLEKACLNEVQLDNQKVASIRDSAAVTRYLFWLKDQVSVQGVTMNEWQGVEKLHEIRSRGENFIEESFATISAYGPNAAMMHYGPGPEKHSDLKNKSFYLLDTGGQYYDGTTDITRTIALGELTEEEKEDFTLTLKCHIDLARLIFLEGSTGHYLEVIARAPLWRHYYDYKCGTGHGFGYVSGVHEGPQRFSKSTQTVPLKVGMIITNEPGVYKEGKHGIRLENDYVVTYDERSKAGYFEEDRYFQLEVLTFVPFDRAAIKQELLSAEQLTWLNDYHAACYEKLLPYMTTDRERADLQAACAPLEA